MLDNLEKLILYLVSAIGIDCCERYVYVIYANSEGNAISEVRELQDGRRDFSLYRYSAKEINPTTPILVYEDPDISKYMNNSKKE